MRVLYLGFFHDGPAFFSGDIDIDSGAEAFTSRAEAGRALVERVTGSGWCEAAYPVCHRGMAATHVREWRKELVHASENAFIDLYRVVPNDVKGWADVAIEPEWRIRVGPRGGARVESF